VAPTSSITVLRAIVATIERLGGDPAPLLRALAIAPERLLDDEARIPFEQLLQGWQLAAQVCDDADFGLHLAEQITRGSFELLDYLACNCATLGAAFERLATYQRLLHDAVEVRLAGDAEERRVRHEVPSHPHGLPRHATEAQVACWLVRGRLLTGRDLVPRLVRFRHAAPASLDEHQRIFRAPIEFGAECTELVLDGAAWDLPIVNADSRLGALLDRHARTTLQRLPGARDLVTQARAAISAALGGPEPTVASIAARLHMSGRTLQRKLAEQGTSVKELLDGLRKELAVRHLDEGRVSLGELSFLLGFSEASAFHRAFRRWTGETPQRYRARQQARK
jgi:AraC-like DNA-binding protein